MTFGKHLNGLLFVLCAWVCIPMCAQAQATTLYQSVERALAFSPQLQALAHNHQAIEYDLKQARARYGPSVDLMLGYGTEQYSDRIARQPGADPSASEWNSRGDATLRLTQKVYDGGETHQNISIQRALLDSADDDLKEATQKIALDAISAHLDVFRQRELVALAEKDLHVHQDIFQALTDIQQAGAGNIADVTQTQARMAQARSILIASQSDLRGAIADYERVVGITPGAVAFAELPRAMPFSLDDALSRMERKNPGLLAMKAKLSEAEARVELARSAYKPRFNIELNSRYYDHLDGDPSWQQANDAMLVMRWNLFNGGQDKQAINAALSRKYQSRSNRDDKRLELRDSTTKAWTTLRSLQEQKGTFREAVASSEKTFEAYVKQYSVSRRSLLDVLNADKEYFQSARGLVNASVDEIIAAYRILNLDGELQVQENSSVEKIPTDLSGLSQAIVLPDTFQSSHLKKTPLSRHPTGKPHRDLAGVDEYAAVLKDAATRPPATTASSIAIEIGPCINNRLLTQAIEKLRGDGFKVHQTMGTGKIRVTRLLEGRYLPKAAHQRLAVLKKSIDAFILPEGDRLAIYVGSFENHRYAIQAARRLAKKNITVSPVAAEIKTRGKMIVVQAADRRSAEMVVEEMTALGLSACLKTLDQAP